VRRENDRRELEGESPFRHLEETLHKYVRIPDDVYAHLQQVDLVLALRSIVYHASEPHLWWYPVTLFRGRSIKGDRLLNVPYQFQRFCTLIGVKAKEDVVIRINQAAHACPEHPIFSLHSDDPSMLKRIMNEQGLITRDSHSSFIILGYSARVIHKFSFA
jgi:hypothetical protein